ncbi:hypothetical protein [Nodularia sphaerocarpa]|uniref:hypothetical protein n=1 Tax=Nodularia sphaerocarpa TaxID=137816 RepID=UPI001EFA6DA5|nr:hypothetical protein [Nodularia sphaerocarpa]ULP70586.1 hypothetical protein BDGGKGIB_00202 [Nodularia sphaerocarpa UHCC 0038]
MSYATALHATLAEYDNKTIILNRQFYTVISETSGEKQCRKVTYTAVFIDMNYRFICVACSQPLCDYICVHRCTSVVNNFLIYYTHWEIAVICLQR